MKTLLLLAVIMAIGLLQVHGTMADFRKMIKFTTGKEPLTAYGFYGCHCGAGDQDYCRRQLCQCDKTAADCLDRNRRTYNKNLQYYNNLLCFGSAPKC
ncbi:PLA2G2A [Cervus elaphus hippelaphus]|uniref:Phospholipase A2, membrane associated n=1 Tax=Cervus elaphus hippelaphus TaxID=46360 RepID=A0A212D427_CEREH|nr:PLA2G2A [Cervus elaphus hippelaphus]